MKSNKYGARILQIVAEVIEESQRESGPDGVEKKGNNGKTPAAVPPKRIREATVDQGWRKVVKPGNPDDDFILRSPSLSRTTKRPKAPQVPKLVNKQLNGGDRCETDELCDKFLPTHELHQGESLSSNSFAEYAFRNIHR